MISGLRKRAIWGVAVCAVVMLASSPVGALVIDFETLPAGPGLFALAGPAQTLQFTNYQGSGIDVTFTGGVILTNTANLPADQTNIYGTANFGTGLSNPLTVTFSTAITNFFLDVYNGLTTTTSYTVADNVGNTATFALAPNLTGGTTQIGFAATGTVVTIMGLPVGTPTWDFFIDNIHFNEALPTEAPEPASMVLLGLGLVGLAPRLLRKRRK
jgi:hypothetical protein